MVRCGLEDGTSAAIVAVKPRPIIDYNTCMKILFLHGWQSVPGGVKPTFQARHGHEVINPKLPDEDFEAAVCIAQAEYDRHRPAVVVGSSRGGAVAMNLESGDTPLVLLCPAWKKYGIAKTVKPGTVVLHSRADDVVPFADSEELVRNSGLLASALIEIGNDHRLADPEPLAKMLEACEVAIRGDTVLPRHRRSPSLPYWCSIHFTFFSPHSSRPNCVPPA
jgi:hypothetical protein